MEVTAYCGCSRCCSWCRGNWRYLKLDLWNRYYCAGPDAGQPYRGRTASGTKPQQPRPALCSLDTLRHPWVLPWRLLFFPWYLRSRPGTLAADTAWYPFGTRMRIPGYGWGVVQDRGSAITGASRIDVYFRSHQRALRWGRQRLQVQIKKP